MKTSLLNLVIVITLILIATSCKKDDDFSDKMTSKTQNIKSKIRVSPVQNEKIKSLINSALLKTGKRLKSIDFDYSKLSQIELEGVPNQAVVAPQINYNPSSNSYFQEAFYFNEANDSIVGVMKIQILRLSESEVLIKYISPDDYEYLSAMVNIQNNTVALNENTARCFSPWGDWGRRTAKCVESVYTDNGWVSLAAQAVTAWHPETLFVFALVCAQRTY